MTRGATPVRVIFTPHELGEASVKGKNVVVIDVFRSTTAMVRALSNGAELVIPLASMEDVTRLASTLDREGIVLCGERDGLRIDGYGLGNSPAEYTPEAVEGKTLLLTTTNGTKAIARCEGAKEVVIAALANLQAVVDYIDPDREWVLLCSGSKGRFALEDALCAGGIVSGMRERGIEPKIDDAGLCAEFLFRASGTDLPRILAGTEAGVRLRSLGFEKDLIECSRVDDLSIVPILLDGRIARTPDTGKK